LDNERQSKLSPKESQVRIWYRFDTPFIPATIAWHDGWFPVQRLIISLAVANDEAYKHDIKKGVEPLLLLTVNFFMSCLPSSCPWSSHLDRQSNQTACIDWLSDLNRFIWTRIRIMSANRTNSLNLARNRSGNR
jgi:hypothetical protein